MDEDAAAQSLQFIASSIDCGAFPAINRAHSRKHAESIGNAVNEASTIVSQVSISCAFAASVLRINSTPACSSPIVMAERKICSARVHGLDVATRNVRDFRRSQVGAFNPFRFES